MRSKSFSMNNKYKLIAKYENKTKPKRSFNEFCSFIEETFNAKLLNLNLVLEPMKTFLYFNIKMYSETYRIHFDEAELNIVLYIIPKERNGLKYYKENYTTASIYGYYDYIYIILVEQLEYYMECNCSALFVDLAIERGISNEDKKRQSLAYIEYLSRIEAKENNYYKDGIPK